MRHSLAALVLCVSVLPALVREADPHAMLRDPMAPNPPSKGGTKKLLARVAAWL